MTQRNDITIEPAAVSFSTLALALVVLASLVQLGCTDITPAQAAGLPIALTSHDLTTQVKTGNGKTAASASALPARLDARSFDVQTMMLCLTRELAGQVAQEICRLTCAEENVKVLMLCGGTPICPWTTSLEHSTHAIVGTPGRIMDHLKRGNLRLGALKMSVLDEADHMFDMGLFDDITTIVR